ncbi:MAG: SpoIIE family protein phosphatase [Terrimicrobiaceae bacterium]
MKFTLSCCLDVQKPELADITETVIQLIGFLRDHGVADEIFLSQFELAAAEAINNATEHGCASSKEKFFRARMYLNPDHVELRVVDPSDFEGWKNAPALPVDPFDEGGRGHFLITQMTDEVLHEREGGCHVLILRKRFSTPWEYRPGEAERTITEMTDELVSSYEMINTLVGLGEWLATAPDMNAFTNGALERLCSVTGAETAYVRFEEQGRLVLLRQWGTSLKPAVGILEAVGCGVESDVFHTGNEITFLMDSALPENDPLSGALLSGFVAPVLFKDQRRGVLVMGRTSPAQFFDAGKLKIARMVAEYLGIIVTLGELQKRRGAEERALRDLEIAAQIQLSLMPQEFTALQGLDLYGTCRPALQAGGDYFDLLLLPDQSTLCVMADVMGKGLPAALLATMLRTNLHAIVATDQTDPGEIIARINRLMSRDLIKLEMFITMVCAWISPDRTQVRLASAGHLASMLQRASDGGIVLIDGAGMPLGIFQDSEYASQSVALAAGDRLMLYTDGIIEATAEDETMFEMERVTACLARSQALSSRATVDLLLDEVAAFSGNEAPSDDRTILLVSRTK